GVDGRGRRSRRAGGDAIEARFEIARALALRGVEVVQLAGVGAKVVELGQRQIDQLQTIPDHAFERRPVPGQVRVQRLEIRALIVRRVTAVRRGRQTPSVERYRIHALALT